MKKLTLIWFLCLTACTPRAVREAERVVAQADSLRAEGRMYGVDEGDSLTLAQAYETLKNHSAFSRQLSDLFPFVHCTSSLDTYAHACYHYGRLLREKDNPVEAMLVFIDATHSYTRDYHILGRIYSNMGSICHLSGDYSLSYDMYEKSAQVFLQGGDTLSYYYLLNNMAFELAEQGKKEESLVLLKTIEVQCSDDDVLDKVIETKVVLYEVKLQHDSVLYYSMQSLNRGYQSPTVLLNRAKAFSFKGEKDSAVYYANVVLSLTNELYDKNNALYILANDDKNKNSEAIKETASRRSDIQKIIEDRRSVTAQATQLLKQDIDRKPDLRWLYTLIGGIMFLAASCVLYRIWRKRKQHQRIILDLKEKEDTYNHLSRTINDLSNLQDTQHQQIISDIEDVCLHIQQSKDMRAELSWGNYEQMCTIINRRMYGMADRLQSLSLSEKEVRLCILVLLQVGTEQMVDMIPYAHSGLGKFKYTTARKMGTTTTQLRAFILNLAA